MLFSSKTDLSPSSIFPPLGVCFHQKQQPPRGVRGDDCGGKIISRVQDQKGGCCETHRNKAEDPSKSVISRPNVLQKLAPVRGKNRNHHS